MSRVVVTGMGIVNSLGGDLDSVWTRLLAGDNGIAPITAFDSREYTCRVAAEVRLPDDEATGLESLPVDHCRRHVRMFLRASGEAYRDSGLDRSTVDPSEVGVSVGTSVNYLDVDRLPYFYGFKRTDEPSLDLARFATEGDEPRSSFHRRMGDLMAASSARSLGLTGPSLSVDTACAASAHAIGEAFRMIRRGKLTAMVAGGACALVKPIGMLAFAVLGALSRSDDPERASRPFDLDRDGFVMGEGGGAVVLENLEHALRRKARIYGEVAGFGATLNAHTLTDPSPEGRCEARAMQLALEEARMQPETIDYVAAHGTSTPKNDEVETLAIKRVFGDHSRRLLISSNKAQIGHTISAAGVSNLIFTLKGMDGGCAPPTMHYESPDPACDLDYVPNETRFAPIRGALVNAFAFGGQNAVLAIRQADCR